MRLLILEDSTDDAELILRALRPLGFFKHEVADDYPGFMRALRQSWDCILADYNLRGFNALQVLNTLVDQGMQIPVIVVTGSLGRDAEATLLNLGAASFVLKGDMTRLPGIVRMVIG